MPNRKSADSRLITTFTTTRHLGFTLNKYFVVSIFQMRDNDDEVEEKNVKRFKFVH